jgi:hypothetical protein
MQLPEEAPTTVFATLSDPSVCGVIESIDTVTPFWIGVGVGVTLF